MKSVKIVLTMEELDCVRGGGTVNLPGWGEEVSVVLAPEPKDHRFILRLLQGDVATEAMTETAYLAAEEDLKYLDVDLVHQRRTWDGYVDSWVSF